MPSTKKIVSLVCCATAAIATILLPQMKLWGHLMNTAGNSNNGNKQQQDGEVAAAQLKDMVTPSSLPIYGNPLMNTHCRNALLDAYGHDAEEIMKRFDKRRAQEKRKSGRFHWSARKLKELGNPVGSSRMTHQDKNLKHRSLRSLPPTFWSREALSALLAAPGHNQLNIHSFLRSNWMPTKSKKVRVDSTETTINKKNLEGNFTRGAYIHLLKTGSSSMANMFSRANKVAQASDSSTENASVKDFYKTVQSALHVSADEKHPSYHFDLVHEDSDCTFAFARDPLHRLISAYVTINVMVVVQHVDTVKLRETYQFLSIKEEPLRFRTFVNELKNFTNEFVIPHPMQHAYTLAGNMSPFFGMNVDFIGRVEHFDEHLEELSNWDRCRDFVKPLITEEHPQSLKQPLPSENYQVKATNGNSISDETFSPNPSVPKEPKPNVKIEHSFAMHSAINMLSRKSSDSDITQGVDVEKEGRYALPQYDEIRRDQKLFNDIVEHYWQDYVCFGYDTNYPQLGLEYTGDFVKPY